jgi:glycosyltransferase involved in cell wall biosynthesis
MNILIIPTNDWIRAPGHGHIDFIAEKLAKRGHKVYAIHFDLYRNEPVRRIPQRVKLLKPPTLPIKDPALFLFLNALFQAPFLFKTIRDLKIQVVINENILYGLIAFVVSSRRVLKIFDFSDYFPESASIYYSKSSPTKAKIVQAVTLAITKMNVKMADFCLAVCWSLIKNVKEIDNSKTCYLLTNGVDTATFFNQSEELAEGTSIESISEHIILVMGVIDEWLDIDTLLKAIKTLSKTLPSIKLVVIGPWRNEAHRRRIDETIESLGLASHVTITGYVSDNELSNLLGKALFCVMPYRMDSYSSIIRLPEKLFMYSAHGKPILSTRLPEVAALNCEHIFFYEDENELANAVTRILREEGKMQKLSKSAKIFAKRHDVSVLAEQLEQVILQESLN